MKTVVSDLDGLIAALKSRKPTRVGIDGVDGVGKSRLSLHVARELNAAVIELDEYVEKNQGGYAPFINYSAVAAKLAESPTFVLEDVCLLEIIGRTA
jgi:shikimate kinase